MGRIALMAIGCMLIISHAAAGDNPLADKSSNLLDNVLAEIGFSDPYTQRVGTSHADMDKNPGLVGYMFEGGYIDITSTDDPSEFPYKFKLTTSSIGKVEYNESWLDVSIGFRTIISQTEEYNEWQEGNVEYASMKAQYIVNFFDISTPSLSRYFSELNNRISEGSLKIYRVTIVVERNPVSDGWVQSEYRGTSSSYNTDDYREFADTANSELEKFSDIYASRSIEARSASLRAIKDKEFPNYHRHGNLLLIEYESRSTLIHLSPIDISMAKYREVIHEPEYLTETCGELNVGGITDWVVPRQPELAALLLGHPVDEWGGWLKVKKMPDYSMWGRLLDEVDGAHMPTSDEDVLSGHSGMYTIYLTSNGNFQGRFLWYFDAVNIKLVCVSKDKISINRFKKWVGLPYDADILSD